MRCSNAELIGNLIKRLKLSFCFVLLLRRCSNAELIGNLVKICFIRSVIFLYARRPDALTAELREPTLQACTPASFEQKSQPKCLIFFDFVKLKERHEPVEEALFQTGHF